MLAPARVGVTWSKPANWFLVRECAAGEVRLFPVESPFGRTPFGGAGRWRERFVDTLIVVGSALCATPAVSACVPHQHLPDSAPLAIVLSTAGWTWVLVRVLRRYGLGHAAWLGPVLGMLNAGTACALAFAHEMSSLVDLGRMFLFGTLFGSIFGSILGLAYAAVVALLLHRLRRCERSDDLDASLHMLGGASVAFAAIAVIHAALDGVRGSRMWHIPPDVSIAIAAALSLCALVWHARVAWWLRSATARHREKHAGFATVDGVLTFVDAASGPFRNGRHALGVVGTPWSYGARAMLLALLLGTEVALWVV